MSITQIQEFNNYRFHDKLIIHDTINKRQYLYEFITMTWYVLFCNCFDLNGVIIVYLTELGGTSAASCKAPCVGDKRQFCGGKRPPYALYGAFMDVYYTGRV